MGNSNYSSNAGLNNHYYISSNDCTNTNIYFITEEEHEFLERCKKLGMIGSYCRIYNEGKSDYSKHIIQPWSIWLDYNLNPWDADIIKRVLRTKEEKGMSKTEARIMDYEKIIHICKERIRQLQNSKQ